MLGVAAAVAITATVVIGVASASATVLCKENLTTCSAGAIYPSGTGVEAKFKGAAITFKGTLSVSCTGSTIGGKTTAERGAPLPVEISSWSFSGCTGCETVSAKNLSNTGQINRTTGGNGTVTLASGGKGSPGIEMTGCAFGISCVWAAPTMSLTGGSPAKLAALVELERIEGSKLCGSKILLTAEYEITSPKPVYVAAAAGLGESVFCKVQADVCPSPSSRYSSGTVVESISSHPQIWAGPFNLPYECESMSLAFKTTAESGNPLPGEITSLGTSSPCGGGGCTAAKFATGNKSSFEATGSGNGTIKTSMSVEFTGCSFGTTCVYGTESASMPFTGGKNAQFSIAANLPRIAGSAQCSAEMKVQATFNVSSPTSLWLEKVEA
jgi:hypothetical protein